MKSDGAIKISELRANLFKLIDTIIATGKSVEIERNGHRLKIVLEDEPTGRLSKLHSRAGNVLCDPDDILKPVDWTWNDSV